MHYLFLSLAPRPPPLSEGGGEGEGVGIRRIKLDRVRFRVGYRIKPHNPQTGYFRQSNILSFSLATVVFRWNVYRVIFSTEFNNLPKAPPSGAPPLGREAGPGESLRTP